MIVSNNCSNIDDKWMIVNHLNFSKPGRTQKIIIFRELLITSSGRDDRQTFSSVSEPFCCFLLVSSVYSRELFFSPFRDENEQQTFRGAQLSRA
jgi:hypothetical protein